jgi:hypothetical protein
LDPELELEAFLELEWELGCSWFYFMCETKIGNRILWQLPDSKKLAEENPVDCVTNFLFTNSYWYKSVL